MYLIMIENNLKNLPWVEDTLSSVGGMIPKYCMLLKWQGGGQIGCWYTLNHWINTETNDPNNGEKHIQLSQDTIGQNTNP